MLFGLKPQSVGNVGPNYESLDVISIIMYDIAYCLNISTEQLGFYELYQQINILNATVTPIPKSVNVNLVLFYNVSIPHAPKSVKEYQAMLTNAVSSGKFTTYMQSNAAMRPNATALLRATSSSVTYGTSIRSEN